MTSERPDVQPIDVRGTVFTIAAFLVAAAYQGLWYLAPDFLALPLWPGAALSVALVLAILAFAVPIFVAWLMARYDHHDETETYETSGH